LHFIFQL